MNIRNYAISAAVLAVLSGCSEDGSSPAGTTTDTTAPLSLTSINSYSASSQLTGLRVTGTGLESVLTFSLNNQELYIDALDDSSALLFYKELPDTGYQMLRAEAALASDSLPVIYRDSIVTFAGTTISWKGELAAAPTSPELNWAYFNTTTKTAYIFDGTNWSTLAVSGTDGVNGTDGKDGTNGTDGKNGVNGTNGLNGLDGISIIWLGELPIHPETPAVNNAYYNTTDGISYIFNGTGWTVLAKDGKAGKDGIDGISIVWLGQFDAAPANPTINNAYYNTTDGTSYIFDGTVWNILAKSGIDGTNGTNGTDGKDGVDGKDGTNGVDGKDGINGIDGVDGISIVWKGELMEDPASPEINWAYYNTLKKASFIFDGTNWSILAKDGKDGVDGKDADGAGEDGVSIIWKGANDKHPATPELNWAYYNTTEGASYIFNGTSWNIITKDGMNGIDGKDGISIVWLGELATAPATPSLNNAYYNTTEGISYIFNGTKWDILAKNGTNGTDGTDGVDGKDGVNGTNGKDGIDGISLIWKGELPEAPANPSKNWAYFNTANNNSYIFNGTDWDVFAKSGAGSGTDGKDGISIVWKGELATAPTTPELNWAYHNTTDGNSYIWDGAAWNMLAKGGIAGTDGVDGKNGTNGTNGVDGVSLIWKGSHATAPADPQLNWGYFNTTDYVSYIYSGSQWDTLAVSDKPVNLRISGSVFPGDTLILEHNLNTYNLTFNGQYKVDGNMLNYDSYENPGLYGMETVHSVPYDYGERPFNRYPVSISSDDHLVWTGYTSDNYVVPKLHTLRFYRSQVNSSRVDSLRLALTEGSSYGGFMDYDLVYHPENEDVTYLYTWEDAWTVNGLYMGVASFKNNSQTLSSGEKILEDCDGLVTAFKMANNKICIIAHESKEKYVVIVDPAAPKQRGGYQHLVEHKDTVSIDGYDTHHGSKDHIFELPDGNLFVIPYRSNYTLIINPETGATSVHDSPVTPYNAIALKDGRFMTFQYTSEGTEMYSTKDGINWVRENLVPKYISAPTEYNRFIQLPDENILELEQHWNQLESTVSFNLYDKYMNPLRQVGTDETMFSAYVPLIDRSGTIHLFGKNHQSLELVHKKIEYGVSPESGLALRMLDANRVGLINNTNEDLVLYLAVNRGRSAN